MTIPLSPLTVRHRYINQIFTDCRFQVLFMIHQLAIRLGVSCMLLATLPLATDEIVKYTQAPHIFSGIGAIASCIGAFVPVLTLVRNSD